MGRKDQMVRGGAAHLVAQARARLRRLEPWEAAAAVEQWAVLVDIRTAAQRANEGEIPGALVVDRNVLEWRLDPTGPDRLPLAHRDLLVIVFDSEGTTSSLAAVALQDVGVHRATDLVGGFQAWRAAGLLSSGGSRAADAHDLGPALAGFASTSRTLQPLLAHGRFGVSVLGAGQAVVARRFASGLPLGDRFQGVPWTRGGNGAPLLDGSISTMTCSLEREISMGDQVVVFGRVVEAMLHAETGAAPLLYHHGALTGAPAAVSPSSA